MTLTLFLSKALLCTAMQCWPVLIGMTTPVGEFTLVQRLTDDPGYGGDVLQFHETDSLAYSIHRPWLLRPEEQRLKRLRSTNPKDRVISKGCVNVDPSVYNELVAAYRSGTLTTLRIEP
jgi:hypothetical protein